MTSTLRLNESPWNVLSQTIFKNQITSRLNSYTDHAASNHSRQVQLAACRKREIWPRDLLVVADKRPKKEKSHRQRRKWWVHDEYNGYNRLLFVEKRDYVAQQLTQCLIFDIQIIHDVFFDIVCVDDLVLTQLLLHDLQVRSRKPKQPLVVVITCTPTGEASLYSTAAGTWTKSHCVISNSFRPTRCLQRR